MQDRLILSNEPIKIAGQDAHDLTLRYLQPDPVQDRCQPFRRHLSLSVQRKTEPAQVGTEAAE
ncbi:hypothetical protein, partial [Pseudoruegeria sp. SK021]|uniref:hypothetical protein n=1 Tax=Pseudoruegeria sp. SK021 TaxID=1933035 RepID=UPI00197DD848